MYLSLVVSEYIRKRPVQKVIDWLDDQDEQSLFISSLTIAELKKGYFKLANKAPAHGNRERAKKISNWIRVLERRFEERILSVDIELLDVWARICGLAESEDRKLPVFDSLLVATAERHNLTAVTCNTADFRNCLSTIEIHNPY